LAAGVGLGTVSQSFKKRLGIIPKGTLEIPFIMIDSSVLLSQSNIERIVEKLTKMRGAALKLGQMLSIQGIPALNLILEDNAAMPVELQEILQRVQNNANHMPEHQLRKVLSREWGAHWEESFQSFDMIPIAAASIGQVHKAVLLDGTAVAVKVQYPGVSQSILSDLDNLKALILLGNFLPKGLYLDNTIRVAQQELTLECDYMREADAMDRFREWIALDSFLHVPKVYREYSTKSILVTEFVQGVSLGKLMNLPQEKRNEVRQDDGFITKIGTQLFLLCMKELFKYRFMQTDPNWTNFLYDPENDKVISIHDSL
jgi:aarF domain-containing kinase